MPVALHLTFNRLGAQGSVLADDLQRCNKRAQQVWEHRVVELDITSKRSGFVDLSCMRASLPELKRSFLLAQEVHLYGNSVASMMSQLSSVSLEALVDTPLLVHGPCLPDKSDSSAPSSTRGREWPGPVKYDLAASLSLGIDSSGNAPCTEILPVDPWSASLIPRQGPTGPIEGLAQDEAVIVCLSRMLSAQQRAGICERVEKLFSACEASVDVGWIDESQLNVGKARKHRRLAQLFVTSTWSDPGCLEAMTACTPFWVMGEKGAVTLAPWLESLGVDPNEHRLRGLEDAAGFDQDWQAAVDLWAQGGSLPGKPEYRSAIVERCLYNYASAR